MTYPYLQTTTSHCSCASVDPKAPRTGYMRVGVPTGEKLVMMGGGGAQNEMDPARPSPGLLAVALEEVKSKVR